MSPRVSMLRLVGLYLVFSGSKCRQGLFNTREITGFRFQKWEWALQVVEEERDTRVSHILAGQLRNKGTGGLANRRLPGVPYLLDVVKSVRGHLRRPFLEHLRRPFLEQAFPAESLQQKGGGPNVLPESHFWIRSLKSKSQKVASRWQNFSSLRSDLWNFKQHYHSSEGKLIHVSIIYQSHHSVLRLSPFN